ncbi:hypothetical protein [Ornithinimicrobium cavernae]|uniref:hypothetical protein n=1 Tax=Ornithinimicrobium cavernae TaxID=2666047 RepID=UPI000D695373|nr:hypothetical protein [Ornithinimicrobium cavernae]
MVSRRSSSFVLGLAALAAAGGLTLVTTGAEAGQEETPAAAAVRALTSGTAAEALAAVPEDFAQVRGYQPVLEDGQLVRADGSCSSPVPLPAGFEPACRQHDYGYDLLRYAEEVGSPLGRWARGAIDDRFAERLHEVCAAPADPASAEATSADPGSVEEAPAAPASVEACEVSATVAVTGIEINSRRQGDGVPEETVFTRAGLASSALGVAGLIGAVPPSRRRGVAR